MGFFSKKKCDICGNDMGRITDKKIKDGGICKECSKKLSPWFNDARQTTLNEIGMQIAARDLNRKELEKFTTTHTFGESGCILIDETRLQFAALEDIRTTFGSARSIDSMKQIIDKNPDIIKFFQIKDVQIKESIMQNEETKTENGQQVSYSPKHMTYSVTFSIQIEVADHPYIKFMSIPLCNAIRIRCDEPRKVSTIGDNPFSWVFGKTEADFETRKQVYDENALFDFLPKTPFDIPEYSYGFKCSQRNYNEILEYQRFMQMASDARNVLLRQAI